MRRLWEEASTLAASSLIVVEARAALTRAVRSRRITTKGFSAAKATVDRLLGEVDFVQPRSSIITHAADLAERHGLKTVDAVHLASALSFRDPEVVIATWDEELRAAAPGEGLTLAA
jgi:predicted nucleic acid-binding protein